MSICQVIRLLYRDQFESLSIGTTPEMKYFSLVNNCSEGETARARHRSVQKAFAGDGSTTEERDLPFDPGFGRIRRTKSAHEARTMNINTFLFFNGLFKFKSAYERYYQAPLYHNPVRHILKLWKNCLNFI